MSVDGEPKIFVVVGLPGVGKSTVLNMAIKRLREEGYSVELINFGDFMLKLLVSKGLVRSRDEIRKLPLRVQQEVQAKAAEGIREYFSRRAMSSKGFIGFVDTHAMVKTPSGVWPGLPEHVIRRLRPHTIIIVESSPEDIVSRQLRDLTRARRDYANVELVKELLMLNRVFSIASAVLVGASIAVVFNVEGRPERAAEEIVNIVKHV